MEIKNRKYRYLITGYNDGQEIAPYVIHATIDDLQKHLNVNGDAVRYYQEIK